ncbi:MAG TPA: hypothetical protein EYP21_08790 [Syntrophaceae bacterium]|nr:hypothetical protein [Syntrophaceae bacterium]
MSLSQEYLNIVTLINLKLFLLSCFLFSVGVVLSPLVVKKNLKIFLFYPLWMWNLLKKYLNPQDHFLKLFLFIFLLNSGSLFCNLVSGFLMIFPFIFSVLLGMHVGIIMFKETGGWGLMAIFLNPVSLLELPAAWISLSMGMEIGISLYPDFVFSHVVDSFWEGLSVYIFVVIPLLAISGIIEVTMIKIHR